MFDSEFATNLMVVFERCDDEVRSTCKTKEEVEEWMRFKYIVTYDNDKKFIQDTFNDNTITSSAELHWFSLVYESRVDYVRQITRTSINLDDSMMSLG